MATFFSYPAARENNRKMTKILIVAAIALAIHPVAVSADDGLVTKPSKHSVEETTDKLEAAINAHDESGWVVVDRKDNAAPTKKTGLEKDPRTGLIFDNPNTDKLPDRKKETR